MRPEWWLPFKHLRKTAAQLVRNVSDGEIAGTFLSHGTPVASDELADRYSNRPFDRVSKALSLVFSNYRQYSKPHRLLSKKGLWAVVRNGRN
jgi:hypothetical protein